jgi:predicted ATP-grasp superfamily ATP-dependent carboligase
MSEQRRTDGGGHASGERLLAETPVIVLNTHYSGLGIARNLAPLGVKVLGLTAYAQFPGNRSRWLEYRATPDSLTSPEPLLDVILRMAEKLPRRPLLLPTRDHDINFINDHREELVRLVQPIAPDRNVAEQIMNKDRLREAAVGVGLAVPECVVVEEVGQIQRARALRFPCICKPVYASQWRREGVWEAVGRQKAAKVETYDELLGLYERFSHLDPLVIVQEWIPGNDESLQIFGSVTDESSGVVAAFTARKRIQYPPSLGTGIAVEALPIPELLEPSQRLLRRLCYRGISEIEYKYDERSGRLYLIEINPRHWDQHSLGTAVGVNLSEALYRDMTGQQQRPMPQSDERVVWLAEGEFARHCARAAVGRASFGATLDVLLSRHCWAVFDRSDIRPFLALWRSWRRG